MRDKQTKTGIMSSFVNRWAIVPWDQHRMKCKDPTEYFTAKEFAAVFPGAEIMIDEGMMRRNAHRGEVYALFRYDDNNPYPVWIPVEMKPGELTGTARILRTARQFFA